MLVDLFEYPSICKNRFILLWTPVARQLFYKLKTGFKKKYSIYTFSKKIPKRYTFSKKIPNSCIIVCKFDPRTQLWVTL